MRKETKVNFNLIYVIILIFTLIFSICNILTKSYFSTIVAILVLLINFLSVLKYKNNKRIFFISLILLYFNYSIIICKYLFGGTDLLNNLFSQLYNPEAIMGLSINLLLMFNAIFYLPISLYFFSESKNQQNKNEEISSGKIYDLNIENNRNKIIVILLLKLLIVLILIYHIAKRITYNTTLFEYLFIIFIFGFLLSKGNKKDKITFEVLLVMCSIYSLYIGERIGVLQFLIADFIINYLDKFKNKIIVLFLILGVIFFTFMGVYGDILDSSKRNFSEFSISTVTNEFFSRRLALDTCVSAYFSSSSMIEVAQLKDTNERLKNLREYYTTYLLMGAKSNYTTLNEITDEYHVNYRGGYIIGYYYYWLGTIGVILIAAYVGYIMRKIIQIDKNSSNFIKAYSVFFITTIPRWYLYVPSLLFRGTLIFAVIYIGISLFVNKKEKIEVIKLDEGTTNKQFKGE